MEQIAERIGVIFGFTLVFAFAAGFAYFISVWCHFTSFATGWMWGSLLTGWVGGIRAILKDYR